MNRQTMRLFSVHTLLLFAAGCEDFWAGKTAERVGPIRCSAGCPYLLPYCDAGFCAPCTGRADLCDAGTYCLDSGEEAGRCAACTADAHCGDGACWAGQCVPRCQKSSDCKASGELSTCVYDEGGVGRCAPQEQVVAAQSDAQCVGGQGDRGRPFCTLEEALAAVRTRAEVRQRELKVAVAATRLTAPLSVVRLLPSGRPYQAPTLQNLKGPLFLVGDDEPQRTWLGGESSQDGLRIGEGAQVSIQQVLVDNVQRGVRCEDGGETARARLLLSRVTVRRARLGALQVRGCDLVMDQSSLRENEGGALLVEGSGAYRITNSFFADNNHLQGPVLQLRGGVGIFRFNTIINNGSPSASVLTCDQGERVISATLILRNQAEDLRREVITGDCKLESVVMDRSPPPGQVAYVGSPRLVDGRRYGDYRLVDSPETTQCCRDQVTLSSWDAAHDYFGTPRPVARADIGAHEISSP